MRRQDYAAAALLNGQHRAGRPGPAGDPGGADRRPVVRPAVPGRHHHDPGQPPDLPVAVRGRPHASGLAREARTCAPSTVSSGRTCERAGQVRRRSWPLLSALERSVGTEEVALPDLREAGPPTHLGWRLCQAATCGGTYAREAWGGGAGFAEWCKPGPVQRLRPVRRGGLPEPGGVAPGPVSRALVPVPAATAARRGRVAARSGGAARRTGSLLVPVSYADQAGFRGWCTGLPQVPWPGQVNLSGLAPLRGSRDPVGAVHAHAAGTADTAGRLAGCGRWPPPAASRAPGR